LGDGEDPAHWGFRALRDLLDKYHPRYMLHGHVHLRYGDTERVREYNGTTLINACERYVLESGKLQVEVLRNLDQVPAAGAILVAAWLRIEGANGLPVRVWAICQD
jgi:kynurenine formamidase